MPVDMKELIAEAALKLVRSGAHRRITVKDIVEECHITRQTFYYHFADVLDLLDWINRRDMESLLARCLEEQDPEKVIRMFFQFVLERKPLFRNGATEGYREALERILVENMRRYLGELADRKGLFIPGVDRKLVLDYHVYGMFGVLKEMGERTDVVWMAHQMMLMLTAGKS